MEAKESLNFQSGIIVGMMLGIIIMVVIGGSRGLIDESLIFGALMLVGLLSIPFYVIKQKYHRLKK